MKTVWQPWISRNTQKKNKMSERFDFVRVTVQTSRNSQIPNGSQNHTRFVSDDDDDDEIRHCRINSLYTIFTTLLYSAEPGIATKFTTNGQNNHLRVSTEHTSRVLNENIMWPRSCQTGSAKNKAKQINSRVKHVQPTPTLDVFRYQFDILLITPLIIDWALQSTSVSSRVTNILAGEKRRSQTVMRRDWRVKNCVHWCSDFTLNESTLTNLQIKSDPPPKM